jgi:hypothetical protein
MGLLRRSQPAGSESDFRRDIKMKTLNHEEIRALVERMKAQGLLTVQPSNSVPTGGKAYRKKRDGINVAGWVRKALKDIGTMFTMSELVDFILREHGQELVFVDTMRHAYAPKSATRARFYSCVMAALKREIKAGKVEIVGVCGKRIYRSKQKEKVGI